MTPMRLTDEQHQLIEAAQGKPVDVVDPQTQRTYVLLAAEVFERVRDLIEETPGQSPAPASAPPETALNAQEQPPRVKLCDLSLPPEVAEEARRYCQKLGLWRSKYGQEVEDEMKLQYYYGGRPVYVVRTPEGPVVIPIEERHKDTPGLRYVLLTPDERPHACLTIPSPWHDTVSQILSS